VSVYFISSGDAVKIGVAKNPEARLRDLQVGNANQLEILATISGAGRHEEDSLHKLFEPFRLRGEWFQIQPILRWLEGEREVPDVDALELEMYVWYRERIKSLGFPMDARSLLAPGVFPHCHI
jgi:hypothetical protein